MNRPAIASLLLVLMAFAISLYFMPQMPERMATHWDAEGRPNGYMDRDAGLFLMPVIMAVVGAIIYFIPYLDPLKKNVDLFREHYDVFIAALLAFLLLIHLQGLLWNAGTEISPNVVVPFGLGLLMFVMGHMLGKAKRNWFIGIRTPWTLSSDKVWESTHRLASKLFMAAGALILLSALAPAYSIYVLLVSVLAAAIIPAVFSYLEFRKPG